MIKHEIGKSSKLEAGRTRLGSEGAWLWKLKK